MKIIALLPFKNEEVMIPSYLSSVTKIADEIVALDDGSTDNSVSLLQKAGAMIIPSVSNMRQMVNMSEKRSRLLQEGRRRGGTHYIWLDADETFSASFLPDSRERIGKLTPGEKLALRWVHIWGHTDRYLTDDRSPFGRIWKDVVSCDDGQEDFTDNFLSESRTPGSPDRWRHLDDSGGVVLHFQFLDQNKVQMKQAWYRCVELCQGNKGPRRINHTYRHGLPDETLITAPLPREWTNGLIFPTTRQYQAAEDWHLKAIFSMFNEHGVRFFEPLQIWHVPELLQKFQDETGRQPKAVVFPTWLTKINHVRRRFLTY